MKLRVEQLSSVFFVGLLIIGTSHVPDTPASADESPRDSTLSFRTVQPDSTWRQIDARGIFTFRLPRHVEQRAVQGIDSYVGSFWGQTLRLSFDYGWYSASAPGYYDQQKYSRNETEIDGHRAIIVSYQLRTATEDGFRYFTVVHFPAPTVDENGDGTITHGVNELTMSAWCVTTTDCAIAQGIFRSIRFKQ